MTNKLTEYFEVKTDSRVDELVNEFIKQWCGDMVAHLLDTDKNKGQLLRVQLTQLLTEREQKAVEKKIEEYNRLEKLSWAEYYYDDSGNSFTCAVCKRELCLKNSYVGEYGTLCTDCFSQVSEMVKGGFREYIQKLSELRKETNVSENENGS